jgi:hypothetical protein
MVILSIHELNRILKDKDLMHLHLKENANSLFLISMLRLSKMICVIRSGELRYLLLLLLEDGIFI